MTPAGWVSIYPPLHTYALAAGLALGAGWSCGTLGTRSPFRPGRALGAGLARWALLAGLARIAGGTLLGAPGAIMALPVAATLQAFVSAYIRRYDVIEDLGTADEAAIAES